MKLKAGTLLVFSRRLCCSVTRDMNDRDIFGTDFEVNDVCLIVRQSIRHLADKSVYLGSYWGLTKYGFIVVNQLVNFNLHVGYENDCLKHVKNR